MSLRNFNMQSFLNGIIYGNISLSLLVWALKSPSKHSFLYSFCGFSSIKFDSSESKISSGGMYTEQNNKSTLKQFSNVNQ